MAAQAQASRTQQSAPAASVTQVVEEENYAAMPVAKLEVSVILYSAQTTGN